MEKKFSVKEFFKSTAFKCIYVLLAIVLVCGVLLAFCNDLFEVTAEEKLNRVLGNIYPDGNVEEIIFDADHETDLETEFEKGAVDQVYLMDDGNYLIHAYGTGGFGGNVYMWVVVEMSDGAISGIGKTQIDKNDTTGETYLNKIPGAAFDFYSENYADGENFDVQDIKSEGLTGGATMSMTGATNAVNTALEFVRTQLLGEETGPDPFEGFSYTDYIDTAATTVEIAEDNESVIFHITTDTIYSAASKVDITVNSEGVITDYTIVSEGTTPGMGLEEGIKDVTAYENKTAADLIPLLGTEGEDGFTWENADESLVTGATMTNFTYVYAAVFAASNYQNGYVMALENSVQYTQYIDMENTTVELAEDGTSVIFSIVAKPYVFTSTFHISITVDNTGTITSMTVPATPADGNGSTEGFESSMDENVLNASLYIGKTADEILDYLGGEPKDDFTYEDLKNNAVADNTITSGATYSNFIVTYSALFAASNYEVYAELIPLKLNQQMSEIYGGSVVVEAVSLDGLTATVGKGTVNTVYSVAGTDDYIVSATGNGGYENGTVTCWIVVETENGAVSGIGNVVIAGNEKQSFISYISDENLAHFGESFDGSDFELADWKNNNLTGGASMSTTAIINSVNIAKNFVSANLISGGENA
ncbi:MAG TPA: hypothetical protein IAB42_00800 [Candidatus Coproplasma avistercoris]|nr:hypothetical protein [Candidatus Coproplasma avistercoris]